MKNIVYVAAPVGSLIEVNLYAEEYSDLNPWGLTIDGVPVMKFAGKDKEKIERDIQSYSHLKVFKVTYNINVEEA